MSCAGTAVARAADGVSIISCAWRSPTYGSQRSRNITNHVQFNLYTNKGKRSQCRNNEASPQEKDKCVPEDGLHFLPTLFQHARLRCALGDMCVNRIWAGRVDVLGDCSVHLWLSSPALTHHYPMSTSGDHCLLENCHPGWNELLCLLFRERMLHVPHCSEHACCIFKLLESCKER